MRLEITEARINIKYKVIKNLNVKVSIYGKF